MNAAVLAVISGIVFVLIGSGCSSLVIDTTGFPPSIATSLNKLEYGMDEPTVLAVMKPASLRWGVEKSQGGHTPQPRYFHFQLSETKELLVITNSPNHRKKNTLRKATIRRKTPWLYLDWNPSPEETQVAIEIARREIVAFPATADLTNVFPISAGGRPVLPTKEISIHTDDGDFSYSVSTSGEHRINRIVTLDLLKSGQWVMRMNVDLDALKVVPHQWTPSEQDIQKARSIAEAYIRKFLEGAQKVEVQAWGDYIVSNERVLVLTYSITDDPYITHMKSVCIDMDRLQIWKDPRHPDDIRLLFE